MVCRFLPFDVKNALIEVCGRSFWFKGPLFEIFRRAGIVDELYLKYEHEPKFKIARKLLGDLEAMAEDGYVMQRRLLTELCRLRSLPDDQVPNRDAALAALRRLKKLASEHDLAAKEDKERANHRRAEAEARVLSVQQRNLRLAELYDRFRQMLSSPDRQARGYGLEELLHELFSLFEIHYRKSYRTEREQIDGAFTYAGFDYLVQARWRTDPPSLGELIEFKGRVGSKIESTRGLFVSMSGFRSEIVEEARATPPCNIILMDGQDLTLILEGRISLIDALQAKAEKASQEGIVDFRLSDMLV